MVTIRMDRKKLIRDSNPISILLYRSDSIPHIIPTYIMFIPKRDHMIPVDLIVKPSSSTVYAPK